MRVNVDKVLERDQKLSELDDRADALQAGASQFESSAAKLKRKYWWKNCKVRLPALACFSLRGLHTSLICITCIGRQGRLEYSEPQRKPCVEEFRI